MQSLDADGLAARLNDRKQLNPRSQIANARLDLGVVMDDNLNTVIVQRYHLATEQPLRCRGS